MILHLGIFSELTCLKHWVYFSGFCHSKTPERNWRRLIKADFGPFSDSNVQQYVGFIPALRKTNQTWEQQVISGMRQLSSRLVVFVQVLGLTPDNMVSLCTGVFVLSEIRSLSQTLSSHCLYPVAAQRRTAAARPLVWQPPDFSLKPWTAHIRSAYVGTTIDILSCDFFSFFFFFRIKSIHLDLQLLHQHLK